MRQTLKEAIRCDRTGVVSSTRIVMLVSGLTLSSSTLWLTVASTWNPELVPALTVFGGALATMAGSGYVANRMTGKAKTE